MRLIPGFDGYMACSDGHIYSIRTGEARRLATRLHDGYPHVNVNVGRRRVKMAVHRLVLLAFMGEPKLGQMCRHLNGIRTDSRPDNLVWGTAVENAADALRHGVRGRGDLAPRLKLKDAQVKEIVARVKAGESDQALADEFGVSRYYPTQLARGATSRTMGRG